MPHKPQTRRKRIHEHGQKWRFAYDASTARFRDFVTGRFIAEQYVQNIVEDAIGEGVERILNFFESVNAGRATSLDFEAAALHMLREKHFMAAAVGRGGVDRLTREDIKVLRNTLKSEAGYFRRFMRDVHAGNVSEAQMKSRLSMYSNKIYNSFWTMRTRANVAAGFKYEQRIVDHAAENCDDCIALAAKGQQPIGTLPEPGDGSTQCLSNCRCTKEYSKVKK